ncbi:ABC-three component system protein [Thioflexithrix psekupsensis]|uniref:ABC-three component system protein n=1 Tax=Thioflexithrix psekupsensis TaxID=1570016 RepID=UPI001FD95EC3|nr:ABC-three component system protein [Thioflexithrix psekupsensis]
MQGFSKGKDGGRDAKFVGTAEIFPSKSAPWQGTVIIQAKHTNGHNRNFLESDFFSVESKSNIIAKEIPKIKNLKDNKQLDHYMLFSNRKLSAIAESEIRTHISTKCGIPEESIYLCGVEQLESYLKTFPDVPKRANLDPINSPLIVSPDDLAEIVEALARNTNIVREYIEHPPTPRISYEEKNRLNNMSDEYATALRKKYLKETEQIRNFLSAPENIEYTQKYETVIDEFNFKIIAKRRDYQLFDDVMNYLTDLLFNRDPVLKKNQKLTRTVLFYMYWNCDIGEKSDAETD